MTTPDEPLGAMPPPPDPSASRPGVIGLHPLTLGEVYSGAKDVLVRNWALLLGLGLAVSVVEQLLALVVRLGFERDLRSSLVDSNFTSGDAVRAIASAGIASLLVALIGFVLTLVVSAVAITVVRGEVTGRRVAPGDAVSAGMAKLGRLVAVTLMLGALAFAGFLLLFGVTLAIGRFGMVLAFAWLVVCVYFGILFVFRDAAIVVEDAGVLDSLRRSKGLVTGGWWRVFGILLLTELAFGVVSWVLNLIIPVDWLVAMVVGAVSTPVVVCVTTLLYFDYRMRKEGPQSITTA